ncbi:MAG: hypothetical protein EPN72_10480 [Nevskiaceae bacterium]|nr:MAG: hypothetical protein EPN63_05490 [Nevskiaceae bacterium]TBR72176.1 MAG: hypothetical protein EPN72_10480 [Nevskiaceae bacterium]
MSAVFDNYLDTLLQDSAPAAPPSVPIEAPPPAAAAPSAAPARPPAAPASSAPPARPSTASIPPTAAPHPNIAPPFPPSEKPPQAAAERWLIFHLTGQNYALKVAELQEVLAWQAPTTVPQAPSNVLGLIHRRGTVVAVIDIRPTLGLPLDSRPPEGAMVLLPAGLALAVDAIGDVFVPGADEQPPPSVGRHTPAIRGLSHHGGKSIILLHAAALAVAAAKGGMELA